MKSKKEGTTEAEVIAGNLFGGGGFVMAEKKPAPSPSVLTEEERGEIYNTWVDMDRNKEVVCMGKRILTW